MTAASLTTGEASDPPPAPRRQHLPSPAPRRPLSWLWPAALGRREGSAAAALPSDPRDEGESWAVQRCGQQHRRQALARLRCSAQPRKHCGKGHPRFAGGRCNVALVSPAQAGMSAAPLHAALMRTAFAGQVKFPRLNETFSCCLWSARELIVSRPTESQSWPPPCPPIPLRGRRWLVVCWLWADGSGGDVGVGGVEGGTQSPTPQWAASLNLRQSAPLCRCPAFILSFFFFAPRNEKKSAMRHGRGGGRGHRSAREGGSGDWRRDGRRGGRRDEKKQPRLRNPGQVSLALPSVPKPTEKSLWDSPFLETRPTDRAPMKLPLVISSTLYTVLPPLGLPKQDSYSATEVSPPSLSSSLDPPPDAMAETTNYTYPSELVTSIIQAGENPIVIYDNKVRDKTVSLGTKTMSSNVNYDDEKYFQRRVDRALTRAERGGTGLRAKRKRPLASWEKRASKVYDIPHECRKYSLFIPLHRLWLQYFSEALGDAKVPDVVLAKIIRADFHGAVLTVTKSKSPNFVGLSGIMVKETENVFNIITRSDELKALPKANNVFSFAFNGILYTLFGNAIKGRPADRIAKKFKARKSVEL